MKSSFRLRPIPDTAVRWSTVDNPLTLPPLAGAVPKEHAMECRNWDDIEDMRLLTWKGTDEALAKKLERSVAAVRARRIKLNREESA